MRLVSVAIGVARPSAPGLDHPCARSVIICVVDVEWRFEASVGSAARRGRGDSSDDKSQKRRKTNGTDAWGAHPFIYTVGLKARFF